MTLANCAATFCFSGRTCPKLARILRALCAVAGRCCLPLVAAVAVIVAVLVAARDARHHLGALVLVATIERPPGAVTAPACPGWDDRVSLICPASEVVRPALLLTLLPGECCVPV